VDPAQNIDIDKDGIVRQGGQDIGQIEIAGIETALQSLAKLGNSYFALLDKAQTTSAAPDTEVLQGKLEQSNVALQESAVRLIAVMRQFEMLEKAVAVDTEMNKQALEEVARVSG
jgi:flagellar basal-body rod protein FlgG